MTKRWKIILITLAAAMASSWALSDPPVYYAKDIRGQVVDAATGQPLEGVVVVARWVPNWIGIGEGGHGGSINTLETVTDQDGKYFIPSWGPRLRPPLAYLDDFDPLLRFFKSNYQSKRLMNRVRGYETHSSRMMRTSEWDGKVIQLEPFKGDWAGVVQSFLSAWSSEGSDCVQACPRYVLALDAESRRLAASAPQGVYVPAGMRLEYLTASSREFLLTYKQEHLMGGAK